MRGAAEPVRGLAHLTLPSPRVKPVGLRLTRDGPLPLPPEGRRGALIPAGVFLIEREGSFGIKFGCPDSAAVSAGEGMGGGRH